MAPGPRLALPVLLGAIALAGCAAPRVAPEPSGEVRMFNEGRSCLVNAREVTVAQYRAYLAAMADPEVARSCRHPREPADWAERNGRCPRGMERWDDDEPVRGIGWWDAYGCARWLSGSITEDGG
jgi:hypothetical protein